jgi:hypothetical protein
MIFIVVEELEGEFHSVSELVGWLGLWKLEVEGKVKYKNHHHVYS